MNDGLGGTFSSRLNHESARRQALVLRRRSLLFDARGERPFYACAPVQTDKTKESMMEIGKEFRDILGERPLTAEELKDIQSNETLSLPGSRETLNAVGGSIIDLVQFGLPDDYYETYAGQGPSNDNRATSTMPPKTVVHPTT